MQGKEALADEMDQQLLQILRRDLGPEPVSYTHLDVYKRQLKDRLTVVDSKKGTGCGPDVLTGNNWVQVGFLDRSYSLEEGE